MNKKIIFFISFLFLSVYFIEAQIAMGEWRTHFAYNNVNQLAQSENKIFAVSDGALFSIDKRDGNMEFYSKISGLNGTSISKIKYDDTSKKLLIIYTNGNIDFMSENGVENLPDFYNKQMSADKSVNHILFSANKAFLSCNFGIVTLNMSKQEIQDTYYIGANATEIKVLNTTVFNNQIYATSATDIYVASLSDPYLISYEHWTKLTGLPGSGNFQSLVAFGDYLILMRNGKLYKKGTDNIWSNLDVSGTYTNIIPSGNYLQAYTATNTYLYDKQLVKNTVSGLTLSYDGSYDANSGLFWFAVGAQGVVQYNVSVGTLSASIKPDGPAVNSPYEMLFTGQKLFVVPGSKWVGPSGKDGSVMILENNKWSNILNSSIQNALKIKVQDFTSIAVDPDDDKHFFVTSASSGVYEFKDDVFLKYYDKTNSTIEGALGIADYLYQWVDNAIFDRNKNLWITNDLVSNSIKVRLSNGNWTQLHYDGVSNKQSLGKILISAQNPNQKWVLSRRHLAGICIFDDGGTIEDQEDDKMVFYSSFIDTDKGGYITPNFFYCLVQDNNNVIWVGTDQGPLLFNNPAKAFDANFTCSRVKIPRNDGTNLADYLLESERIKAIAIDGANRKWIGTETSGVYLMSENGQQTLKHFTAENSPLLSNSILSIAINPVTGEVFFGTANGLVSYQSDAAEGTGTFENVHAYPNPVRENFTGVITITGLVDKTNVKITDLAGNLVCQTVSNGSIATWDGKNKYGKKVSTGVYLVICISPDGQESTTTKILIIN
ncbi:putative immunoreactive 84 kDa antigen PG93 [uncultured Paludibacter sp.]|uniref:Putative immunoreactive 84 kDa antigen PG93 n=1 Tax=uncultured Paludibacter sp. TaxID=497635 RepID=A0A653ADH1_9BACT|nr:putative immunoreactive 84 kDa antigen PG93 [uncultured Paludibacter sp.]